MPSLGIAFYSQFTEVDHIIDSANLLQRKMKNSYAIIVNSGNVKAVTVFATIQQRLNSGNLRVLRVSPENKLDAMIKLYLAMRDKAKLQQQVQYFQRVEEELEEPLVARRIMDEGLTKLQISWRDRQLLMDGLPSIAFILSAERDLLHVNSPVELETIDAVCSFFSSSKHR